jgi:hypothetical protein
MLHLFQLAEQFEKMYPNDLSRRERAVGDETGRKKIIETATRELF